MRQRTISTMNLPSAASVPGARVLRVHASELPDLVRGGGRLLAADGATGYDICKQRVEERVSPVRQSAERLRAWRLAGREQTLSAGWW